jgi:hypothetical protein
MTQEELKELEDRLWQAADKLRVDSGLKASEYATPILGLIFLRFASIRYNRIKPKIDAIIADQTNKRKQQSEIELAIKECGFYLPPEAQYDYLLNLPEKEDIAKAIKHAMELIVDAYGDKVMAASFCKQIRTTSIPSLYLYYFINYLYDTGMIEAFQVQSTGISNYQFEPFLKFQQIILPTPELMQLFHDHVIVIQKQIATLGIQNDHLRQIRDRLLPRLISGKLEVKNIDKL